MQAYLYVKEIEQALAEAAQAWADGLTARTGEGEYFFCVNRYLFLARNP